MEKRNEAHGRKRSWILPGFLIISLLLIFLVLYFWTGSWIVRAYHASHMYRPECEWLAKRLPLWLLKPGFFRPIAIGEGADPGKITGLPLLALRGAEIMPVILKGLDDDNPDIRSAALDTLGNLGHSTGEVRPALIRVLFSDKELRLREQAASYLLMNYSGSQEMLIELIRGFHESPLAYDVVTHVLYRMDSYSRATAIASLTADLTQGTPQIRVNAARGLFLVASCDYGRLISKSPDTVNAILQALKEDDSQLRKYAVISLGFMRSRTPDTLTVLLRVAETDESLRIRKRALISIGLRGDEDTMPILEKMLAEDRNRPVADNITDTIRWIERRLVDQRVQRRYAGRWPLLRIPELTSGSPDIRLPGLTHLPPSV